MAHETKMMVDRFVAGLADLEKPPSKLSLDGFRSLAKRLATHCPKLPTAMAAFRRYLDDTGEATLNTVRRRYDFANRFFKSGPVRALDISNPCDRIARPGKIVAAPVWKAMTEVGESSPASVAAPVLPAFEPPPAEPPPTEYPVVSTRATVLQYLERCRQRGLSELTIDNYAYPLGLLAEASPTLPPTEDHIYEVLGDPLYVKTGTRRQRYGALSAFFKSSTCRRLGLPDPLKDVKRPPKPDTIKRVFEEEEIAAMLAVGDRSENALVRLGLDNGVRVGEAASITVDRIGYNQVTVRGKKGLRVVPISPEMAGELRALANERGEVWHNANGRMSAGKLSSRFRKQAIRAGLTGDELGPNTLRRTFATFWSNVRGRDTYLQDVMGHNDWRTTEEYVVKLPEELLRIHSEFSPARMMGLFGGGGRISPWKNAAADGVSSSGPALPAPGVALELARLQGREEARIEMELERLAQTPCVERKPGRPEMILPRDIARLVQQDLDNGYSQSAIVYRFRAVRPFSRYYLATIIADGRLERMANS